MGCTVYGALLLLAWGGLNTALFLSPALLLTPPLLEGVGEEGFDKRKTVR